MSRARGPQSPSVVQLEVRSKICAVPSLGQVVAVPLQVGHAVRAARDDAEVLVAEPHHGEVRAEAAARREHRRVDDLAELHVHLPHRDLLHALERARADDVEDAERGEVEHRGAVAHRQVLGVDDRRPPARVPLGLAVVYLVGELLEQRRVRVVPVRPLPAGGLVEDRVERLLALVERRAPDRPARLPLLARVHDPVGLVEALGGAAPHELARLLVLVEARDVGRLEVDLGLALDHPLGHGAAHARALLDPHRGGGPEPAHLGRLAEDRQAVGRERQQPVDRVLDAHGLVAEDLRHELERVLHLLDEVVLRERQLGGGERRLLDRGDLLGVVQDRPVRVGARPRARSPSWRSYMFVSMSRTIGNSIALFESAKCGTGPTSIIWWTAGVSGIDAPASLRDARAPDAAGDHDVLGLHVTAVGAHAPHAPALDVDAGHLGVRRDGERAGALRLLAHERAGSQRVHHADALRVEAAEQDRSRPRTGRAP